MQVGWGLLADGDSPDAQAGAFQCRAYRTRDGNAVARVLAVVDARYQQGGLFFRQFQYRVLNSLRRRAIHWHGY